MLIGCPSSIAGKLLWSFGWGRDVRMLMLRHMVPWLADIVLAWSLPTSPCRAADPPPGIIFDTDAGGD